MLQSFNSYAFHLELPLPLDLALVVVDFSDRLVKAYS